MNIQLSEHFTYRKLLRFVLPSIVMMIFTSIYSVVDGLFVSNFVGKSAFAAINLMMPFLMGISALGFMIGTGGSALVAKTLGEGKKEKATEYFSMLVYITLACGLIISILSAFAMRPVAIMLGARDELLKNCVLYGRILCISLTCFMLLDFLFVAVLHWGLAGAAIATVCGELIGGIFPIFYFGHKNSSLLKLGKTHFYPKVLLKTCTNGSSELMTNLSSSLVNSLYNLQLMKFAGEDGVAAYGTIMYVNFIFAAIYFGYSIGSAPLVSYHHGAANHDELKNLFHKSVRLISTWAISLFVLAQLIASPLASLFVGYDPALFELTRMGFRIYCFAFLINGFNIYGSAFFTALNNGLLSALISFLRTLVFQMAAILILPLIFGINGI